MTYNDNFYYKVMSFVLKNAWETYQRLMETIFYEHTNQNLKVYIYDMMVKKHDEGKHCDGVRVTLASVRRNNMRMNKKNAILENKLENL